MRIRIFEEHNGKFDFDNIVDDFDASYPAVVGDMVHMTDQGPANCYEVLKREVQYDTGGGEPYFVALFVRKVERFFRN